MIRHIQLMLAFAEFSLRQWAGSAPKLLWLIVGPFLIVLPLIPVAKGQNAPQVRTTVSIADTGPEAAAVERWMERLDYVRGRTSSPEAAERALAEGASEGLVRTLPPAAAALTAGGAPPAGAEPLTIEVEVRDLESPWWGLVEVALETPPAPPGSLPVLLDPVPLPDEVVFAGPIAGFLAVLLGLSMIGIVVMVLQDRLSGWKDFIRVAPVAPMVALTGLAVGQVGLNVLSWVWQMAAIEWVIGLPAGTDWGFLILAVTIGFVVTTIIGVAVGVAVPAIRGVAETVPQASFLVLLVTPIFWHPGDVTVAQLVAAASPVTPVLDLMRLALGAEPVLMSAPVALAASAAWTAVGLTVGTWAAARGFRPVKDA